MQKAFSILALTFLLPLMAMCQTTLNGGIMSGRITKTGSPYKVKGDILVPRDSTLIIEAGVILDFDSSKLMRIEGTLKSLGTKTYPNLFTCSDSLLGWLGMYFLDNKGQDTCEFYHTRFEYVSYPNKLINSPLFDTLFHNNGERYSPALFVAYKPAPFIFRNCTFFRNWNTFVIWDTWVVIDSCLIKGNLQDFGLYSNGAFGWLYRCHTEITNNRFENNTSGLFHLSNAWNWNPGKFVNNLYIDNVLETVFYVTKMPVKDCSWLRNRCKAIRLGGGNEQLIENCVFDATYGGCWDGGDIRVQGDARGTIIRNCVFKNKTDYITSVYIEDYAPLFDGCIFTNNIYGIYLPPNSSGGRFVNCLFEDHEEAFNANSKAIIINSTFVNNRNKLIDPNKEPRLDSTSGCMRTTGYGSVELYNCIFWGNTNYAGKTINMTIWGSDEKPKFFNCIVEGGMKSITKDRDPNFAYSGTFINCDSASPTFVNEALHDYRLTSTCAGTSVGFDQGYSNPIPMFYIDKTVPDILKAIGKDGNGKNRIYGSSVDIGAYEIQAIGSQIDLVDTLKNLENCVGDDAVFLAKASSLGLKSNWQAWKNNVWKTVSQNQSTYEINNVQPTDSGTRFRIQYTNECGVSKTTDEAKLIVHRPIQVTLPKDTTILHNQSLTIKASSGFSSYRWSNDSIGDELNIKSRSLKIGDYTYQISAIDKNNCESSDSIKVSVVFNSSIKNGLNSKMNIFPNPAKNVLYFEGTNPNMLVEIRDLMGRTHILEKLNAPILDISTLKPSTYVITIYSENTNQQFKLIVND